MSVDTVRGSLDRVSDCVIHVRAGEVEQQSLAPLRPTLIIDFDGVLHSYVSGWQGIANITDPPTPGAQDFCRVAMEQFRVVIISTRCTEEKGWLAIMEWLEEWSFPFGLRVSTTGRKEPATVMIDDRAIQFVGEWPDIDSLVNFTPWNKEPQEWNNSRLAET